MGPSAATPSNSSDLYRQRAVTFTQTTQKVSDGKY